MLFRSLTEGDGGDLYNTASAHYQKNAEAYERLAASFNLERAAEMEGVRAVVDARNYAKASNVLGDPDAAVGYGASANLDALQKIGNLCGRIATEHAAKARFEAAATYLDAQFMLGLHLFEQRLGRPQLSAGLGMMAHAATLLKQMAAAKGDADTAKIYGDFLTAYQQYYRENIEPMERVITSADPKVQSRHVGDVMVIAKDSAERTWRIEATLKLGRIKYFHNTAGDRRATERL